MRTSPFLLLSILGALVLSGADPTPGARPDPDAWSGLSWSAPTAGPNGYIRTMLQVGGSLVAVGTSHDSVREQAMAWRSADGISWQSVPMPGRPDADSNVAWLVPIPEGLLAVGWSDAPCTAEGAGATCPPRRPAFWLSTNGGTWLRVPTPAVFDDPDVTIGGIAAGPDGLVAVGDNGFHRPRIWSSPDGIDWERVSLRHDVFAEADLWDVAWTPRGWLVVGSQGGTRHGPGAIRAPNGSRGSAWYSTDGRTWHAAHVAGRRAGPEVILQELYPGADGTMALGTPEGGQVGAVWVTGDGRDWSFVDPSQDPPPIFPIATDGRRILGERYLDGDRVGYESSTGSAVWQPLAETGAIDSMPRWPGADEGRAPSADQAFILPDGVLFVGTDTGGSVVWHATAMP